MKRIEIPSHALERMLQRGASETEIIEVISGGDIHAVRDGRFASRKTFEYNMTSPINQKLYSFKTVEVNWVDELEEIVVVTAKVYYHNQT